MIRLEISFKRSLLAAICLFLPLIFVFSQQNQAYLDYIRQYSSLAVEQMQRHRIPASITLSQGLLESAAGKSTLATQAHNHFGIKVSTGWTGPYIVRDDDARGEHFRKYRTDAESFEDHSLFLKKPRYARLFQLDIRDYKGWARGLKACGYATNPAYAESLIRIIENYQLYRFDSPPTHGNATQVVLSSPRETFFTTHPVMQCNRNYYILVQEGDDLQTLSRMVGVSKRKLRKYNELPKPLEPEPGSVLYLESKRNHADKSFKRRPHILQAGQSLYDVAQMYGIKLKSLYKMNHFPEDYAPHVGEAIRIY